MAEEPEATGDSERGGEGKAPLVFVVDASLEADRIADTLRGAGYIVADVSVTNLLARAVSERPNVVILDADVGGVTDTVERLRRLPGSGAIDFVYLGMGDGAVRTTEDALANQGSAFFLRPVDGSALARKVEALTGGPIRREPRAFPSSIPPPRPSTTSMPSPGIRTPGPPLPMSTPSLAEFVDAPRSLASFGAVSSELQALLNDAERRAEAFSSAEIPLPSPEEEIESVLPADVLASLDEPLDEGDDDVEPAQGEGGFVREGGGRVTTSGGRTHTTSSGRTTATPDPGPWPATTNASRTTSTPYPRPTTSSGRNVAPHRATGGAPRTSGVPDAPYRPTPPPERPAPDAPHREPTTAERELGSGRPQSDSPARVDLTSEIPAARDAIVLGPDGALRYLADAIRGRATGAISFEHARLVRRIVLKDGDFVTASSSDPQESLVCFLGIRGELVREDVERLVSKVPPFGRHAGAALVAHGCLKQDQLWSVLRAHAEWIATAVLREPGGTAQIEDDLPGRLRNEPSVFAATTGPAVFVELVRRAVPAEDALGRLGGETVRLSAGPHADLLDECALGPAERELVEKSPGGALADLLRRTVDGEVASVIYALVLLGVLEAVVDLRSRAPHASADAPDVLDEAAVRARVRARLELVDEGDYFAVLGVTRDATGYDIRRAFLELRRAFEPTRLLTPRLLDLEEDVRKITVVLEEAYEILRDGPRRDRYKRAIEARPGG